jgi:hypothetical protein
MLPALVLHLQYVDKNFKAKLEFDRTKNRIIYQQKNNRLDYSFQDISQVIKIHSSTFGFTNARHSFTNYYFYKFVFNDNVDLIITCLLANDLEIMLGLIYDKETESKFKLFPSV